MAFIYGPEIGPIVHSIDMEEGYNLYEPTSPLSSMASLKLQAWFKWKYYVSNNGYHNKQVSIFFHICFPYFPYMLTWYFPLNQGSRDHRQSGTPLTEPSLHLIAIQL